MIKSQADEGLEEATAPVVTSTEIHDQSAQIAESTDDVNTVRMLDNKEDVRMLNNEEDMRMLDNEEDVRMLDNEEDEESSNDNLEPPPRHPVPKSSTLRMLDDAVLELQSLLDLSKKDKPAEGGSSNVV